LANIVLALSLEFQQSLDWLANLEESSNQEQGYFASQVANVAHQMREK